MLRAALIAWLCAAPVAAQQFFTLKGHGGPIMDVTVGPSGEIVTASFDNSVGLWKKSVPRWFEGARAAVNVVLFPPGNTIYAGGDDFKVRAWDLPDGGTRVVGTHTAKVMALALSRNGALASASWDHRIGLWPSGDYLRGHTQGVNDVAFSRDGQTLYSASVDGTVRVWDINSRSERLRLVNHGFGVNRLVLNEEAGWLAYGASDGGTRVIDLKSGAQIADLTLDRRPILSMAHHAGTGQIAVGDGQGYIMVIDTTQWRITHDFRATSNGPIWALAFSPDGQNIHAGGIEDTLYSWPVDTMDTYGPMSSETRSFLENPDALPNGERQFKRKCSICHALTPGSARKAGPTLYELFGRRAGTVADYGYSDTLAGSDIVWTAQTIDGLFNEGPDHYIPGTKMPMQRITNQADRIDLINFLRRETTTR